MHRGSRPGVIENELAIPTSATSTRAAARGQAAAQAPARRSTRRKTSDEKRENTAWTHPWSAVVDDVGPVLGWHVVRSVWTVACMVLTTNVT